MLKAEKKPYYGKADTPVEMRELKRFYKPVDVTFAFGDHRYVLHGILCISHVKGSLRWGEQIQITVHTQDLPRRERRAKSDGYSRMAINLEPHDAETFFKKGMEAAWSIV